MTLASTRGQIFHSSSKPSLSSPALKTFYKPSVNKVGWQVRSMGGYIEDAQIASLGLEIYQEINGLDKYPIISFVIPHEDDNWPVHLWGYKLGEGVEKHIATFLSPKQGQSSPSNAAKMPSVSSVSPK